MLVYNFWAVPSFILVGGSKRLWRTCCLHSKDNRRVLKNKRSRNGKACCVIFVTRISICPLTVTWASWIHSTSSVYFLNIHVLCAPIYPKCYIGTVRNVLLIGKRKRKRPLRRPRNRWEVQCKIKVDALLNIGLYYFALKMEAKRSSETTNYIAHNKSISCLV